MRETASVRDKGGFAVGYVMIPSCEDNHKKHGGDQNGSVEHLTLLSGANIEVMEYWILY